jgi:hypothetical protein
VSDLLPGEDLFCEGLARGDSVTYRRVDRSGYGFAALMAAVVVRTHESGRVTIRLVRDGRQLTVGRMSLTRDGVMG